MIEQILDPQLKNVLGILKYNVISVNQVVVELELKLSLETHN